jgi:orotate phosphoribosyltransferase
MSIYTGYLGESAFDGKRSHKLIKSMIKLIKKEGIRFSTIVYRGHSGAIVAPAVAVQMRKNLALVRKPKESSHSHRKVEGYLAEGMKYIIIDDFIDSGKTIKTITDAISDEAFNAKCVGVFLWQANSWSAKAYDSEGKEITVYRLSD